MQTEKYEHQLLRETAAGREALAVMKRVSRSLSGEQKVAKAFELTEMTRQIMRAGIRAAHPDASEQQIQDIYVDRLLRFNGTSLAEVRRKQMEQSAWLE